jgi:UDP-glucose 4-epimerase
MSENDAVNPLTYYGLSKFMGENLLRIASQQGLTSYVIPRLFFIYGPNQYAEGGYKSVIYKSFENILNGLPVEIYGSGLQVLDYVYIDDCIDALIKLAYSQNDREVVNVASGDPITINRLTNEMLIASKYGQKAMHTEPDWTHGSKRFGNPNKIERLFGWRATTILSSGLESVYTSLGEGDE